VACGPVGLSGYLDKLSLPSPLLCVRSLKVHELLIKVLIQMTKILSSGLGEGKGWGWERGMSVFQKKKSCRLILRGKVLGREYPAQKPSCTGKKNRYSMSYNAGKKDLHPCMSGKKILLPVGEKNSYTNQITHTPPAS